MQGTTTTTSSKAINPTPMATTDTSKDDSGLHDLKALASSAKRRRNKRRTTQMEAQDSLLASTAALEAVVLPDPSKSVAMPVVKIDVETTTGAAKTGAAKTGAAKTVTSTTKTSASVETSVATELAAPPDDSKGSKVGLIAAVGVVGVAAAAFVLFGGKGDSDKQAEAGTPVKTPVAQIETANSETAAADTDNQPGSDTEPTLVAAAVPEIDPGQEATGDGSNGSEIAGKEEPTALVAEETKPEEAVKDKKTARILTDEEKAEAKLKREERLAAKKIAKEEAAAAKAAKAKDKDSKIGKDKSLSNGDSLDDVLSSVTGGLDKQVVKKDTKPTKTSLGRSDVKKAMKKVAGRAKSCYSQEEFSGMVTVKYGVKPDGSLSNVNATGSHAGSKTGKCVVKAVKTAKFPAYSGSPMTFTYPFMLSP